MKNRTVAILVAAAALVSFARGELFGPPRPAPGRAAAVAISEKRGGLALELRSGDRRIVVIVTRSTVATLTDADGRPLLARLESALKKLDVAE